MARSERTTEDIRRDLTAERQGAMEALGRLGNDVDEIVSDLQRQAAELGRKAAMVAPAAVAVVGTFIVWRRRRRRTRAAAAE